jgi:hypothetical protein
MVFMNKRLNNLVGQAKVMAEETLNKQISKNAELDAFAEKFAELIVKECLVTLDSITAADRDALWIARKVIADHFGVE